MFGPRSPMPHTTPGGSVSRRARPDPKLDRSLSGRFGRSMTPSSSSHQSRRWAVKSRAGSAAFKIAALPSVRDRFRVQRLGDELAAVRDAVEGDETAHAGALAGAEQGLVESAEPVAQIL